MNKRMSRFEHIAPYYEALFPARPVQLDFLEGVLPEGVVPRWADVPCGTGQQLEGLADRGRAVWGMDLDTGMIDRLKNRRPDLADRVVTGDMRASDRRLAPLIGGGAGVLYCVGNSLVQLTADEEITAALESFARLLVAGGAVAIQIVNFDRVLAGDLDLLPRIERVLEEGTRVVLERRYEPGERPGCVGFHTRLETPLGTEEKRHQLRALCREELEELAARAGFSDLQIFGNYRGDPWTPDAPATILVGRYQEPSSA
jgi:glycine/sarcosine N-methyltransferase